VQSYIERVEDEFEEIAELDSIGKSFRGTDVPLLTLGEGKESAVLIDGAHHSRELVSYEMPLYIFFRIIHGYVHNDPLYANLLNKHTF